MATSGLDNDTEFFDDEVHEVSGASEFASFVHAKDLTGVAIATGNCDKVADQS